MNQDTLIWYSDTMAPGSDSLKDLLITLNKLVDAADIVLALEYEALRLNPMFLDRRSCRSLWGERRSREMVSKALGGSSFWQNENVSLAGAISVKSGCAVHGAVRDGLVMLSEWIKDYEASKKQQYTMTGMSIALDMMNVSLAHLSKLITNRLMRLTNPAFSGLREFLGQSPQLCSGLQSGISGIDARVSHLSTPCGFYRQTVLNEREDLTGDFLEGAWAAGQIADLLFILLAAEGFYCMKIFELRHIKPDGAYTAVLYERMKMKTGDALWDRLFETETMSSLIEILKSMHMSYGGD